MLKFKDKIKTIRRSRNIRLICLLELSSSERDEEEDEGKHVTCD